MFAPETDSEEEEDRVVYKLMYQKGNVDIALYNIRHITVNAIISVWLDYVIKHKALSRKLTGLGTCV